MLERFKQNVSTTTIDGDRAEKQRRLELSRYTCRLINTPILLNCLRSALGEIEKRSQELLEKHTAARFLDKGSDSGEVVRLVERFREAIIRYQVSENCFVACDMTHTV